MISIKAVKFPLSLMFLLVLTWPSNALSQNSTYDFDEARRHAELSGGSWTVGETSMTRLTSEERAARLIPFYPGPELMDMVSGDSNPMPRSRRDLPSRFDWRDVDGVNWMTPVRDQGDCGSCWAHGANAAAEGQANIYLNNPNFDIDLSEQFMVSCGNGSCSDGGLPDEVLNQMENEGVPDEACYPYIAQEGNCANACSDWRDRAIKITSQGRIVTLPDLNGVVDPTENADQIKQRIMQAPLVTNMVVRSGFYSYSGGVFTPYDTGCYYDDLWGGEGHVVALVGWDDANNSWIAKNSWDDDWGDGGYFEITRGTSCFATYVNYFQLDPSTLPAPPEADLCIDRTSLAFDLSPGDVAGPEVVVLSNCGGEPVQWIARPDVDWIEINDSVHGYEDGGRLSPGESTNVRISVFGLGMETGNHQGTVTIEGGGDSEVINITAFCFENADGDEPVDGDVTHECEDNEDCPNYPNAYCFNYECFDLSADGDEPDTEEDPVVECQEHRDCPTYPYAYCIDNECHELEPDGDLDDSQDEQEEEQFQPADDDKPEDSVEAASEWPPTGGDTSNPGQNNPDDQTISTTSSSCRSLGETQASQFYLLLLIGWICYRRFRVIKC